MYGIIEGEKVSEIMRKLAKSSKYQNLFALAKEMKLKLFNNDYDFSDLQLSFIQWLNFYYILNWDIDMGDIDDIVFLDPIYEEAYIYYKHKTKNKTDLSSINKQNKVQPNAGHIQWVFKKP